MPACKKFPLSSSVTVVLIGAVLQGNCLLRQEKVARRGAEDDRQADPHVEEHEGEHEEVGEEHLQHVQQRRGEVAHGEHLPGGAEDGNDRRGGITAIIANDHRTVRLLGDPIRGVTPTGHGLLNSSRGGRHTCRRVVGDGRTGVDDVGAVGARVDQLLVAIVRAGRRVEAAAGAAVAAAGDGNLRTSTRLLICPYRATANDARRLVDLRAKGHHAAICLEDLVENGQHKVEETGEEEGYG